MQPWPSSLAASGLRLIETTRDSPACIGEFLPEQPALLFCNEWLVWVGHSYPMRRSAEILIPLAESWLAETDLSNQPLQPCSMHKRMQFPRLAVRCSRSDASR